MRIYFTRHGETEWNSRNIICGTTDIKLSEKGIRQAEQLADTIADGKLEIDLLIVSPMKRAQQTAAPIAQRLGLIPLIDERLREWDYGSYEGKPRDTEGFAENKIEFGCRMPGGESVFDVVSRVYGLVEDIKKTYKDKNILLVCHGGICRVLETYARNMTRKEFSQFFMGNCELRQFDIKQEVC